MMLGYSDVCRKKAGLIWSSLDAEKHLLPWPTFFSKSSHECISFFGVFHRLKRSEIAHSMHLLNIVRIQQVSFCFGAFRISAHCFASVISNWQSILALPLVRLRRRNAQGWFIVCIYLIWNQEVLTWFTLPPKSNYSHLNAIVFI